MSEATYSFGAWLRGKRKERNLTQKELAERAYCSLTMIKKIEVDQRRPSRQLAESLAAALALPDSQQEIFIEAARGERPVDHLSEDQPLAREGANRVRLPRLMPLPLRESATPLLGRESELQLLRHLLAQSWLVTIVGIGGIGKTRLALAYAADQQRAGLAVAFVDLARLKGDDDLAAAILEALNLVSSANVDPIVQLLAYLQRQALMLVMDNFEHLLENAGLLTQMHRAAPGLTVLATSRERLGLPGEQMLPLQGLHYPLDDIQLAARSRSGGEPGYPAGQLFLNHARRLIPDYTPNDDELLLRLCRMTNGLPLALQLAAAWIESMTLADLVQELEENLDLLNRKAPGLPARHHSIRAVFDTTWRNMSAAEQEAFARLTVFNDGFTRQAAHVVVGTSLRLLSDLVARNLIQLERRSDRYLLHELLRQYGAEQLAQSKAAERELRTRHAQYFCDLLAGKEADLKNANQHEALAEIQADRANIWLAWQWAAHNPHEVSVANAIDPLGHACQLKNWIEDGHNLFTRSVRTLSIYREQPDVPAILLHLNLWQSRFATLLGRLGDARLAEAQQLLAEIPPSPAMRQMNALHYLVAEQIELETGKRAEARIHGEQAVALYEQLGDPWSQAHALDQLGNVCWNVGQYAEARRHFEEGLALRRQIGDRRGIGASLGRLGLLLLHQSELALGNHFLAQAAEIFSELGDFSELANVLQNLGFGKMEMGQFVDAHAQYDEAAIVYQQHGLYHAGYAILKALTAYASVHAGRYERAGQEAQEALSLSRQLGYKRGEGLALIALGKVAAATGDDRQAATFLDLGTDRLRRIDQLDELSQGIGVQALAAYRQGQTEKARQFVLSALAITTQIRGRLSSPSYPLAVWALTLAEQGDAAEAASVYQLAIAEPFSAGSRWFAEMFGCCIAHTPGTGVMRAEERWVAIAQLYKTLQ